jgi:hypothetical protein
VRISKQYTPEEIAAAGSRNKTKEKVSAPSKVAAKSPTPGTGKKIAVRKSSAKILQKAKL